MEKIQNQLEVLVATMNQEDTRKYQEMNLQTDAVIANQTDCYGIIEEQLRGHSLKMISTDTRGLSRNRNIALALSSGDLIMFLDDDDILCDGYEQLVLKEFQDHPEAQAILFTVRVKAISAERKLLPYKPIGKFTRINRRLAASCNVCGLVIQKKVLNKYGLHFNEEFGTGTENYCGEDTIFLQELLKKRIKLYLSSVVIAETDKSESTWFDGFNRKRFYINGKVLAAAYPLAAWLIAVRSAYRFSKRQNQESFIHVLGCYYRGIYDQKHT